MLRVGLTGGIGSGKTTISRQFKALYNTSVIDADDISHELISPTGSAYQEVIELFGMQVVLKSGEIDRKYIRDKVFNSSELRLALENIIHPKVKSHITKKVQTIPDTYCLIVIPLLFESGMQDIVDRILVVDTKKNLQLSRVTERDKCSGADVEKIIAKQIPAEERLNHADDIIINNGSLEDLVPQIKQLHQKYIALAC